MNEVQEAAPEVVIKHPELPLTLIPPNWSVQRQYPLYLERQTIQRLCVHQADYPVDVFKMQLAELNKQFSDKTFNWRKEAWQTSLEDQENRRQLAYLTLTQERRPGSGPVNPQVTEEWLASIWEQPYADDGDLWYQQVMAAGREMGKTILVTYGDRIWQTLVEFLNRPNSPTPAPGPGTTSSTSPKSPPSS
ncbi:MAG: hypothetical protein KGJ09_09250 [Candidatus Omnitrophica bacterium]|nr:hypothetical protein [Candidatus Omnitrophota bacterium]